MDDSESVSSSSNEKEQMIKEEMYKELALIYADSQRNELNNLPL